MELQWRAGDYSDDEIEDLLFRAARRYDRLVSGGPPEPVATTVRLQRGETAHADEAVHFAFYSGDEDYVHERPGSYLSPTAVLGAMIRNSGERRRAEVQWRNSGVVRVVLTDQRLLVMENGTWLSLSHDEVVELRPAPVQLCLIVTFHGLPPIRLRGPAVPALSITYAALLYPAEQLPLLTGFDRFDPSADPPGDARLLGPPVGDHA